LNERAFYKTCVRIHAFSLQSVAGKMGAAESGVDHGGRCAPGELSRELCANPQDDRESTDD
jgi:hypothetical protein